CSVKRWIQTALSSSQNAVSISSARTMKRFPSRCTSTIQIVRFFESTAEARPKLCRRFGEPPRPQFPILAIPAQQLFDLIDVIGEKIVEENPFFPVHRAFVRHYISIFVAHWTQRFDAKE